MKIIEVNTTTVNIPYTAPTIACAWRKRGLTRTIVEIVCDDGVVGLGEIDGGHATVAAINRIRPALLGRSPHDLERILWDITPPLSPNPRVQSGLEMALWDIMGKAAGVRVCDLLGGAYRERIPISGYLFFREANDHLPAGEMSPEAMLDQARMLVERHGFGCLKLKAGVLKPSEEVRTMMLLRDAFGPEMTLRIDPNAIWSPEESIRLARQMSELDLEWIEDPTAGIEAMRRVRTSDPTPLATNMCVRNFPQLADGIRVGAVDVVLGDPAIWGGISACKKLAAVCDTFSLGFCLHSAGEFGISTAAFLHIAASTPSCSYAIDSHLWLQEGEIAIPDFHDIEGGCMRLPQGPGLGVSIDREALAYHAALNQEQGDYSMEPTRHMRYRWWA